MFDYIYLHSRNQTTIDKNKTNIRHFLGAVAVDGSEGLRVAGGEAGMK